MIIIKFRYKEAPGGIQVRVFSGQANKTLSCNGVLSFTREEFEHLALSLGMPPFSIWSESAEPLKYYAHTKHGDIAFEREEESQSLV